VSEKALRKHGKDIILRQFIQSGSPTRSPTSTRRSRCCRASRRSSRTRASRSRARSATSPRRSARAAGRVESNLRQVEDHDDDRMTAIAKLVYNRGNYGYALFED
jgi:ribosomal protein L2